jgi:hypothetical protein
MLGVNRPGIVWVTPDKSSRSIIDAMAMQHVEALRMALVPPTSRVLDIVEYAHKRGIKTLLLLPLTQKAFYRSKSSARPASRKFPAVSRLSQLDTTLVQELWVKTLEEAKLRDLDIAAVQVGNEINSAQFNGDLPILQKGLIVNSSNKSQQEFWSNFEVGLQRTSEATRIVKQSIQLSGLRHQPQVLVGSMVRQDDRWIENSGNVTVEPDLAFRTLLTYLKDDAADLYSIHIYPDIRETKNADTFEKQTVSQIDSLMRPLLKISNVQKKWWITEWGIPSNFNIAEGRRALYCRYLSALRSSSANRYVTATFVYDWDENPQFDVWYGQRVLNSDASIFEDRGMSPCRL